MSMRNYHSGVKLKHDRSEYGGLPRHSFSLIKRNESGLNLDCGVVAVDCDRSDEIRI